MEKISVRFDPKTVQLLQEKAAIKQITPSEYIRQLVEIGLRIEEYSSKNTSEQTNVNSREKMMKDTIISAFHTNLLVKNIFLFTCESKSKEEKETFLRESAEKARRFVAETYLE